MTALVNLNLEACYALFIALNFKVNVVAIKNDNKKYKFEKITSANLTVGKPAAEDIKIWIDSIGI